MNTWSTPQREGQVGATMSRRELVDAQVGLLWTYLEKRPAETLIAALERLVECCRISFREEEALMGRLGGQLDAGHRARHQQVLSRLEALRSEADGIDRGRLLARLIEIDRELIAHVADAVRVDDSPR